MTWSDLMKRNVGGPAKGLFAETRCMTLQCHKSDKVEPDTNQGPHNTRTQSFLKKSGNSDEFLAMWRFANEVPELEQLHILE